MARVDDLATAIDFLVGGVRSGRSASEVVRDLAMNIRRDDPTDFLMAHQPDVSPDAVRIFELDRLRGPEIYERGALENWGYADGAEGVPQLARMLRSIRGNPDAVVPIYRGVPAYVPDINTGNWVSASMPYAREHAINVYDPMPWTVLRADVPARDIVATDYLGEFGYAGDPIADAIRQLASPGIGGTRPISPRLAERIAKGDPKAIQAALNRGGIGQLLRQGGIPL